MLRASGGAQGEQDRQFRIDDIARRAGPIVVRIETSQARKCDIIYRTDSRLGDSPTYVFVDSQQNCSQSMCLVKGEDF
jgi:hypothetical protein